MCERYEDPDDIRDLFVIIDHERNGYAIMSGQECWNFDEKEFTPGTQKGCYVERRENAIKWLAKIKQHPFAKGKKTYIINFDLKGYSICYLGPIDLYYNVLDKGFSTYLHQNCFIETFDEAKRLLKKIKDDPTFYLERQID